MLYFSTYQSSRQNKKLFEWRFCYLNSFLNFKFRAFRPIDQSELLHWPIVLLPSSYTDHYLSCLLHLKTTKKTFTLFSMVTRWSRSTSHPSHSYLRLVKIWQVSSCKNLWRIWKLTARWSWQSFESSNYVLNVFLHWIYKMKCCQESFVIPGGLFTRFLVEKCAAWQKK